MKLNQVIRWYDYITININWLGISTLSQTMAPLVVPLLVQRFVGDQLKGTYYGTLRLWTLMVALLAQSLAGMISDHCTHSWGRRRPFIFFSTLVVVLIIILIGFSSELEGLNGYWILFILIIFQMGAINISHGAQQGLIPDLVPESKRGIFSGLKALLEIPIPIILISFSIARLISSSQLWYGLSILIVILMFSMLLTMLVPEQPQKKLLTKIDWEPFVRLLLMTAAFTLVIMIAGKAIQFAGQCALGLPNIIKLLVMGSLGVVSMGFAIVTGVWISIRIGIGKEIHRISSFAWWVINRLTFLVGAYNIASFIVYFLQARLGYIREEAAAPAAQLTMLVGIFILLSVLPSGWLADRFGKIKLLTISGIIAALGTLIALLFPNIFVINVGGCLIGSACGLFFATNWALGTKIVPVDQAGYYLGISNLAGAGAGAIGAYIGGPIADYFTKTVPEIPGVGYLLLFIIYGVLFLLSIMGLKGINEDNKKFGFV